MAREVGATHPANLPDSAEERKKYPVASGVLRYFPDALVEVARVSYEGNQQHNPGEPLHWARGKSNDQEDTLQRHFLQLGTKDTDGQRHAAKMAWRALAILQLEIEAEQDLNTQAEVQFGTQNVGTGGTYTPTVPEPATPNAPVTFGRLAGGEAAK
jgi:hypothetical protein